MKKYIFFLFISIIGYGQITPAPNTFENKIIIKALTNDTSGLEFTKMNNLTPTTSAATAIGVDATGKVVTIEKNPWDNPDETPATQSSYDIVYNNGNVGIGTTAPTEKLDVAGKTKTTTLQVTSGAVTGRVLTSDGAGNATWAAIPSSADGDAWGVTGEDTTSAISRTGNVGIGTAVPSSKLDVLGNAEFTSTNVGANTLLITGGGIDNTNTRLFTFAGAIELQSNESTATNRIFSIANTTNERVTVLGNGNVGIGTTAPQYLLDVNGTARIVNTPTITNATKVLVKNPTTGQISEQNMAITIYQTPTTANVDQYVTNDQLFINNSTGIILKSANGTQYKITVNDDGSLKSQLVN